MLSMLQIYNILALNFLKVTAVFYLPYYSNTNLSSLFCSCIYGVILQEVRIHLEAFS